MLRFVFLVLLSGSVFAAEVEESGPLTIIGGTRTDSRTFPTALYVAGCTGSLIAERWALTAAHCVAGKNPIGMTIERGYPEDYERRESVQAIVHPEYVHNPDWTRNDVALVQFDPPFGSPTVEVQALADAQLSALLLEPGTMTTSVGFGRINREGDASDGLWQAQWSISPCPSILQFEGYVPTSNDFCRKQVPWKSQIHWGDSGGPVLVEYQGKNWQIGWVTYNANATIDGRWQYYSISHKTEGYLPWIREIIDATPIQQYGSVEEEFRALQSKAQELDNDLKAIRQKLLELISGIERLRSKTSSN